MTKILYIPTGEYIKLYPTYTEQTLLGQRTIIVEESVYITPERLIDSILRLYTKNDLIMAIENNLISPILREELLII
ncbi:MAG: hypothetical protein JHC33_14495 [Ignisphaera sp.]|nr:hypothetical protein [Ignisphaera sp.]